MKAKKKEKYLKSLALYEILKGNISLTFRTFLSSLICSFSLSFFLILSFSLFSFLSASYSTSIDDDGQQVNTRKNETKRKEEEGEIRGHEVLFFFF